MVGRAATSLTIVLVAMPLVSAQRPTFRSGVEVVALNVSVTDTSRQFIRGLGAEDFSVFENGVRRDVTFFGADAVPIDAGLLLDVSGSMREEMGLVVRAAVGFIRALRPTDRVAVMGFADRIHVLQGLTSDVAQSERAVREARSIGRTALHDALYIAAREFDRRPSASAGIRRRVLVVLTDGADTSSLMGRDEALAAVRRAGMTVFTISPHPRLTVRYWSRTLQPTVDAQDLLTTLAADTGGRAYFLEDLKRLPEVYKEIAADVFQQYTIGYEARDEPGWGSRFRQLLVKVATRPDAIIRTRRGYDPPAPGRR